MDMKRFFLYFITIAALALAGCGGGGGGGTSLTVGGDTATQALIDALAAREDITPAMVQELRDEITRLMALPGMEPADVQALRDEIAMLMMREDITPAAVQALRDEITRLSAGEPVDVQALRDRITMLMMRPTQADLDAAAARADAFETAQNARDDATGAASTAEMAVTTATEASDKITARMVGGDSAMAEANAQAVLDAYDDANEAVTTAQTALDNAKAAVDPDAGESDALARALTAAIEAAEGALKDAKEQAESDALKAAVEAVKGDDPKDEGYPTMPAQHGKKVAMDIGGALLPTDASDGSRKGGEHTATVPVVPTLPADDTVVRMNDHQGMTWAEIVGDDKITTMRIAVTGTGTKAVDAASFADMPLTSITESDPPAVGDEIADGTQYGMANYKGVPGTVFCAGACKVEGEVGSEMLTGSWFFTPTDEKKWYVGTTTDGVTMYSAETLYAQFGHWLGGTDAATVETYAMTEAGKQAGPNYNLSTVNPAGDNAVLTDSSANYSGPAAGMSVYKTFNTDGTTDTIQSAPFTAMVNLKATFGPSVTLGGTVNDFLGDAVGSGWTVELQSTVFDGNFGNNSDHGRTVATGRDGEWTAQAYGPDAGTEVRPTGIFGGFNAHFSDGHAAGAYATRKE